MSSSEDEIFESSPDAPPPPPTRRLGTRRKASTPSPSKCPKKRSQRDILTTSDFNVDAEDEEMSTEESESDEEVVPQRKNRTSRGRPVQTKGKAEYVMESNEEGEVSRSNPRVCKFRTDEVENTPPTAGNPVEMQNVIPEESGHQREDEAPSRTRKRLSIRSNMSDCASSVTSDRRSGVGVEPAPTPSEVQNIYETCSNLFNANRINQQNAFNLRLLECINQMINSPGYDKSNMQLTSSTVEIGTKIYVCRVDNTHSHVLALASDISLQQRRKKKESGREGNDAENPEFEGDGDDGVMDEDGDHPRGKRQKQKRADLKKRGRFIEQDNAKLLTGLEEQNVKYVTRRNFLKKKFNEMISEDLDFDYLSYCMEPDEENPLETAQELENMKSPLQIPDAMINQTDMSRLVFLPFHHLKKFDPETHDVWGRSLSSEEMRDATSEIMPDINPEFAYDPASRPAEYPDDPEPDHMNDTFGDAMFQCGEDGRLGDIPPISFHQMSSLDHLEDYFQRIKNLLKTSKSKYGWCGPNFARPKSHWPVQKGVRKARVKKEPEPFDFKAIDFTNKLYKFNCNNSARIVFDDKVVEGWSTKKTIIPFLGIELSNHEEDFHPLDFESENDPKFLPPIFKLFTSRRRSILDLLKSHERRRNDSGRGGGRDAEGDDGFDDDHDVELPREIAEDFCSQPANEMFQPPDCLTQPDTDGGWPFPASLPGHINEEPLSHVSGIDSIQFSRKPKPIDMNALKKSILSTLQNKLNLNSEGDPLCENETRVDLAELMLQVLKLMDFRTEKLLSVPIFIVALMHVIADKRLFVMYDGSSDPDCPVVICRGKNFNHYDFIPMPSGCDYD